MSLLEIRDIAVAYGKIRALAGVSLRVDAGEVVALVGANGAGKSTLMRAIMGLVPVSVGDIRLGPESLLGRRAHQIARLGVAYVPEGRATLKNLTVRENLVLGAFARRQDNTVQQDLASVLQRFPVLAERLKQTAGTLSGGEQQMLVIGRALMSRPQLMLLDEPTLGLAPLIAKRILETVADLAREGVTILLVEQNAQAALKLAGRAYVLETGRVVLEGSDLLGDQRVREAYLGELAMEPPQLVRRYP